MKDIPMLKAVVVIEIADGDVLSVRTWPATRAGYKAAEAILLAVGEENDAVAYTHNKRTGDMRAGRGSWAALLVHSS
jgi:hypothetical protein